MEVSNCSSEMTAENIDYWDAVCLKRGVWSTLILVLSGESTLHKTFIAVPLTTEKHNTLKY